MSKDWFPESPNFSFWEPDNSPSMTGLFPPPNPISDFDDFDPTHPLFDRQNVETFRDFAPLNQLRVSPDFLQRNQDAFGRLTIRVETHNRIYPPDNSEEMRTGLVAHLRQILESFGVVGALSIDLWQLLKLYNYNLTTVFSEFTMERFGNLRARADVADVAAEESLWRELDSKYGPNSQVGIPSPLAFLDLTPKEMQTLNHAYKGVANLMAQLGLDIENENLGSFEGMPEKGPYTEREMLAMLRGFKEQSESPAHTGKISWLQVIERHMPGSVRDNKLMWSKFEKMAKDPGPGATPLTRILHDRAHKYKVAWDRKLGRGNQFG